MKGPQRAWSHQERGWGVAELGSQGWMKSAHTLRCFNSVSPGSHHILCRTPNIMPLSQQRKEAAMLGLGPEVGLEGCLRGS